MVTKLYPHDTTANGIGSFRDADINRGAASTSGVVNTAASGTNIQWTKTAGGAVLEWISGRVPAGGFTLSGLVTVRLRALESNMNANCGGRIRLYKRAAAGGETELGGSPWNDGVEFGTADAAMDWTFTPTSMSFAENDRLIIRFFITNVGTMATGFTCTMTYDGPTDGAAGDTFVQINETVTFKLEDISGSLAITEGSDTVAMDVTSAHIATLAVTEDPDTFQPAAQGTVAWAATLAVTEDTDTAAMSGEISSSNPNGDLAVTEGADTLAATATVINNGTIAATEAADVFAATVIAAHIALMAATEEADTFAAAGFGSAFGSMAVAEDADTFAADGILPEPPVIGSLAASEDSDIIAMLGFNTVFVEPQPVETKFIWPSAPWLR